MEPTEEPSTPVMPAMFIGHGSPMNTLETNRYTESWRALGGLLARPRAILVVSAHWFIGYTAVTAMPRPRTIHDFFGFPDELFEFDYPAPGSPDVAAEIADLAKPSWVGLDIDGWGLDHGTWSVLAHLVPAADVPVVQLSLNATKPLEFHLELGRRLAPLRERGVLIVGSGNVAHNLRRIDWRQPDGGFDWARRFDEAAGELMTTSPGDIAALADHRDFETAVPIADHFLPLVYVAGVAAAAGSTCDVLIDGYTYGSLSMTAYTLDVACPDAGEGSSGAAAIPDPSRVPPDEANV